MVLRVIGSPSSTSRNVSTPSTRSHSVLRFLALRPMLTLSCFGSRLPSLRLDPHRKREIERRSLAGLGFDPDAPAVHLDDALGDRQAQTGSALPARDRAVGLLELLEDFRLSDRG